MRAISCSHADTPGLDRLLLDTRSMVRHLLAYALENELRSPIALRKATRDWFQKSWRSRYAAAYHESACSSAIGVARSYWRIKRRDPRTGEPRADRLRITLHQSLARLRDGELRVTVRPGFYLRFPLDAATKHKRFSEWSAHKLGEVTLTAHRVVLPFQVPAPEKLVSPAAVGIDLNLRHAALVSDDGAAGEVRWDRLANAQSRFQRLRERVQGAIPRNLQRQRRVLRHYTKRQRNVTADTVRKNVAPAIVKAAAGRNVIFEDLSANFGEKGRSRDLRRKLARWTHGLIQREVERRSPARVVYVNPRGISQECPRCGGK